MEKEKMGNCPLHGEFAQRQFKFGGRVLMSQCPQCESEWSMAEETRRTLAKSASTKRTWEDSGVRERFFGMSLSDFKADTEEQRAALEAVSAIASGGGRSLVLCGNNGTGKTMLASIAVMARGGRYVKMQELASRIKSTYVSSSKETEMGVLDEMSSAPVLAVDEIGRQYGSASERNWLSYIVDERYCKGLPTILVSNLLPSKRTKIGTTSLEDFLGADVVDRLAETADIVCLQGDSFRRKSRDDT